MLTLTGWVRFSPAGSVTTALTLLTRNCRLFATCLRFAVGALEFGLGGAFWLAPGAGGLPGPRTPFAGAVLALATSRTVNGSGCDARLNSSPPVTAAACTVMAASTPFRIRFMVGSPPRQRKPLTARWQKVLEQGWNSTGTAHQ